MKATWQRLREGGAEWEPRRVRGRVIKAIRAYFDAAGFEEVETPLLVAAPGMEPYLEVFETRLVEARGASYRAFLATSPEYAMKKLLVAGVPRLYQICKSFRNGEEVSRRHNPEFTILEWYRADADYTDIMADCEGLLLHIWHALHPDARADMPAQLTWGGQSVRLDLPWERVTVREAFARYAGVDLDAAATDDAMRETIRAKGYADADDASGATWEQGYHQLFLNEIEPHLGFTTPTILYDYPASMAALARRKPDDPQYAERFEFYAFGVELGNAFSELTDATEQEARLRAERDERAALGKVMYDLDADFLAALRVGMPPSGGIAVGVDRLVMLFAGVESIHDTLWFPAAELFQK